MSLMQCRHGEKSYLRFFHRLRRLVIQSLGLLKKEEHDYIRKHHKLNKDEFEKMDHGNFRVVNFFEEGKERSKQQVLLLVKNTETGKTLENNNWPEKKEKKGCEYRDALVESFSLEQKIKGEILIFYFHLTLRTSINSNEIHPD